VQSSWGTPNRRFQVAPYELLLGAPEELPIEGHWKLSLGAAWKIL